MSSIEIISFVFFKIYVSVCFMKLKDWWDGFSPIQQIENPSNIWPLKAVISPALYGNVNMKSIIIWNGSADQCYIQSEYSFDGYDPVLGLLDGTKNGMLI